MRLTRRGKAVLTAALLLAAFTVGFVTADWCWYGYCGL
jgi:hypothetical protein